MQTKISKTLEGLIARTAFDTSKQGETRWLKDRLLLEIVREEGSLAYQLLSARLKDWELYQVRLRIERDLQERTDGPAGNPEEFYVQFANELRKRYRTAPSVSTAHALHAIISDEQTIGAHVLEMYHITPAVVEDEIRRMSTADEPRAELHVRLLDYSEQGQRAAEGSRMLDKFGVDLTRQAREGKIDPVIGRECEIERVVQILSRRKKNNPILIGEAGVGKSAIVEGLALRIAAGDVPYTIAGKRLYSLDVSSLVAGTKFRGEFEERMQQLLDELRKADDTIIFIDEIHTIVGAGSTQGSLDTANILKPALARGELQTIGATTLDEYRENIEKDSALERRFQRVLVEPTSCEETLQILRNIAPRYEAHHKVRYTDEALEACVTLTNRYITDRFFPDKAIDVMDEAGSRARAFDAQVPESLKLLEQEIEQAAGEKNRAIKMQNYELAATLRNREGALRLRLQEVEKQWRENMARSPIEVGETAIREVIASMTGIPLSRISGDEQARLLDMERHLGDVVIGQDEAVRKVTRAIRRSRAGLKDANRPIGVFMFVGPTGVGKTHVAKELAKYLFDTEEALVRVDMSEYSEKHNVSRLIGSPPGYVGYGEGGQLTEKVRRRPYCVLLFDEIEKAHPDVFNLMLQIFDEGQLTDGLGRRVDFRNTIIIMTSNVGSREATQRAQSVGYNTASKPAMQTLNREAAYRKNLERSFAPEFINRIDDIVTFGTLSDADVLRIVELELGLLSRRVSELGYSLDASDEAKRLLVKLGYEPAYGVRSLRRTILDRVEEPLSELIVAGAVHAGDRVTVCTDGDRIELSVAPADSPTHLAS